MDKNGSLLLIILCLPIYVLQSSDSETVDFFFHFFFLYNVYSELLMLRVQLALDRYFPTLIDLIML